MKFTIMLPITKLITRTLMLLLISIICLSCSKKEPPSKFSEVPILTVTVTNPKLEDITQLVNANGAVKAWRETIISAEVGGLDISEVNVDVGDEVHKGQILAKLNAAELNADLKNQIASVSEAKANLAKAKTEERQVILLEKAGAVSAQQLLSYTTNAKNTQAQLEAAKSSLKLQQIRLNYTVVRAPADGIISSRTATAGSIVQNGSELFRLIKANRLEWQAEVSASDMAKIKPGQSVTLDNGNVPKIIGTVRQVAPDLNQNTLNGLVYVDLPAKTGLKLGEYLAGSINIGTNKALVVPASAVIIRDGFYYIMRLNSNNHVSQVKIQLTNFQGSNAIIESGISPTDRIVNDGSGFLFDGNLVRVVTSGK